MFSIILSKTSKRKFQTRRAIVKLEFLRISSDFIQQEEILQSLDFARKQPEKGNSVDLMTGVQEYQS